MGLGSKPLKCQEFGKFEPGPFSLVLIIIQFVFRNRLPLLDRHHQGAIRNIDCA